MSKHKLFSRRNLFKINKVADEHDEMKLSEDENRNSTLRGHIVILQSELKSYMEMSRRKWSDLQVLVCFLVIFMIASEVDVK